MNLEQNGEIRQQYTQVFDQHIITGRALEGALCWSSAPAPCVMEQFNSAREAQGSSWPAKRLLGSSCTVQLLQKNKKGLQRSIVELWEVTVKNGIAWAPWLLFPRNFQPSVFTGEVNL